MLSSLTTACGNIEFYARELCRRVLRPRDVILSFMPAGYVVEFYDRVPGCRVCWPRAKIGESAWSRAKISSVLSVCKNDESAGHVLKCRVFWPRAKNDDSKLDTEVTNVADAASVSIASFATIATIASFATIATIASFATIAAFATEVTRLTSSAAQRVTMN